MRQTQDSERPDQQMIKEEEEEDDSSKNVISSFVITEIKQELTFDSGLIKKENEMDFSTVPDSSHLTAKKRKVETYLVSEEELPQTLNITKTEVEVAVKEIKKEAEDLNPITKIKVEKDLEFEEEAKCTSFATIPEISNISLGEIKIEDGIYNKTSPLYEEECSDDEGSTSAKIIYEEDSNDVDMSSGEENSSSAVSKWNDEDEMPTTSRKAKKEKQNLAVKKEKVLKIKEETNNEADSDQEDTDVPSEDEGEFLSDASGEEFLSDGDENSADNQLLNVDNKAVVTQLIDEYHKRPQLWFKELSTETSNLKEQQLFRSIKNALNNKLNMKFNVNKLKTFLKSLCTQYEVEIERQLQENEETVAESSSLWFYDKLFFLKDDIESIVKAKLEKTLKVLDDNVLADFIDIYKKYDELWDTTKATFRRKKKCHETLQSMRFEIKDKLKISINTFKLEYQLLNVHKKFREEKRRRLNSEMKNRKYKPLLSFITKCDFLENHQPPFKCPECTEIYESIYKFRQHKAQHDGTPPFKCHVCKKVYKSYQTLYYHNFCHNGLNYNCSICGNKFLHPAALKYHIKLMHITVAKDNKKYNCDICGKVFAHQKAAEVHKKQSHAQQPPVRCKICSKLFKHQSSLRKHYRRHGTKSDCSICERTFNHPSDLGLHMKRMHNFTCKICDEVCSDKKILNQHMALHEGKHLYCDICGRGFDDERNLRNHKTRMHVEKEFKCKICSKGFNNQQTYKCHLLRHNDAKYDCDICGKRFVHPGNLIAHMHFHNQKYQCSFCGKNYAYKTSLCRHVEFCEERKRN